MPDTIKGLGIINEAEIDLSVEFAGLFQNMVNISNLVSGATTSAKTGLLSWEFSINDWSKSFIQDVQQDFAEMGN